MNKLAARSLHVVLALAFAPTACAWNAAGHKVIAEIAWRKLPPAHRAAIAATLRQHPRFVDDFQPQMDDEANGAGSDAEDHWIFCHAATWPDIARGIPAGVRDEFHRPRWHYINLPVFLDAEQAAAFAGHLPANIEFELPVGLAETSFNGVQAIKNSIAVVTNASTSDSERAIHYCWLLHVLADLHQPLHSASLYSEALFPTNDRGGNSIRVRRAGSSGSGQNLHSLWDGFLGRQANFSHVLGKANELIEQHPSESATPFVALPFDVWTTETQQLALDAVYGPILEQLRDAESSANELPRLELPTSYFQAAGAIASRQAVIAGARMAGLLASLVDVRVNPGPVAHNQVMNRLGFPAAIAVSPARELGIVASRQNTSRSWSAVELELDD